MEDKYNNLEALLLQIEQLEASSNSSVSHKNKMEDYECSSLITQSKKMIEELDKEIADLNIQSSADLENNYDENKLDNYIKMLSLPNPKFSEVLYIAKYLKNIDSNTSKEINIQDNIENDISRENIFDD
nr:hypothetical protein [Mimivirus sp.]